MNTKQNEKHDSDAGFFEKNFLKLKSGKLWEYIISRIIMFLSGVTLGLFYIRDAAYVHSTEGIPLSILYAVGFIFFMNGIRKMVWGFVKLRDAAWDESVAEKPHHRHESNAQRFFLRFPSGQRRHLVSAMSLLTEGLACLLLIAYFIALVLKENLFELSLTFPFVLKPFVASVMTFPKNMWMALIISGVAVLISYINNSLFLMKIPQVRMTIAQTLKGMQGAEHLLLYFPTKAYELLRGIRGSGEAKLCDRDEAEKITERILSEYPEHVISGKNKIILQPELVELICKEQDPLVLLKFLRQRIFELKND